MAYVPVHQLEIHCLAEELSDIVWNAFDRWDAKAKQTLGLQLIRAADSIAVNLAEGYGRYTPADRKRFYIIARGSLEETKAWLRKAIRRSVLAEEDKLQLTEIIKALGPKLNLFIKNQNVS